MKFWQHIIHKLQDSQRVYLLTVIESFGSSPGRKGFKMMVAQDGFIFGSVGGGVMEFSLVEEVKKMLKNNDTPIFLKEQVHQGKVKDGSGMICSGRQTVVFHPLRKKNISTVQKIIDCFEKNKKGVLELTPNSFDFSPQNSNEKFEVQVDSSSDWNFQEQIAYTDKLYIIGGGHVGLALSELMSKFDFSVTVFDNREDLNTMKSNHFAHQTKVIDYTNITNYIPEDGNTYVAIMTNMYKDDKLVLSKLIHENYNYIGVLGSKAKLKKMWNEFLKEGVSQQQLDIVFAPIGLSIKSETVAEIAISIVAQLIQVKNKK